jgi:histidyl-tRNA synthetase
LSDAFQSPRGTLDWLPGPMRARRRVVERAREIFERAGYREVATPVFEDTGLFARTSGEGSEVVQKEMYSFQDKGERPISLRPELTAPLMRAYLGHGMAKLPQPVRLWTVGACYRYNAVQRGRLREFNQFDAEAIGSVDPATDAELIALQAAWYGSLGIDGLELELNSVGDAPDRGPYLAVLVEYLDRHLGELSEDVRRQRDTNPLRAFDTKDERSAAIMADAPKITDHLSAGAQEHFEAVCELLTARSVAFRVEPTLVRGLDYYTRTAWEFKWPQLGAQSTIGGGGRYDGLAEAIGGPPTPGVGFGAGLERLLLALGEAAEADDARADVFFAILHPPARPRLLALLDEARARGLSGEADLAGRGAKGQFRQADRSGARLTVVVGEDEWSRGAAAIRDMTTGEQVEVPLDGLVPALAERIGR